MTWETYKPRGTAILTPGVASLAKTGVLTVLDTDLEKASILGKRVEILMDRENSRISLRTPESEIAPSLALCVANKQRTSSSKIHIGRVIKSMGLTLTEAVRCQVIDSADELIILIPLKPAKARATPIRRQT